MSERPMSPTELAQTTRPVEVLAKPVSVSLGQRGIELRSLDDAWRFADFVVKANMAPKGMNQAGVVVALELGMELGLPPMAAVQNIMVVNGRPSVWGDMLLAICQSSAIFDHDAFGEWFTGTGDALTAHCRCRRLGRKEPVERTFSVADAKKSGLWAKEGPWQQYPNRMLQMRARGYALRDAFADVTKGIYAREEMDGDIVAENKTPRALPPIPTSQPEPHPSDLPAPTRRGRPPRVQEQEPPARTPPTAPETPTKLEAQQAAAPTEQEEDPPVTEPEAVEPVDDLPPPTPKPQPAKAAVLASEEDLTKVSDAIVEKGLKLGDVKRHIQEKYNITGFRQLSVDACADLMEWINEQPG